jgi:hypothetical protein
MAVAPSEILGNGGHRAVPAAGAAPAPRPDQPCGGSNFEVLV